MVSELLIGLMAACALAGWGCGEEQAPSSTSGGPPAEAPQGIALPAKAALAQVFTAKESPTKSGNWRFTGSGAAEGAMTSFPQEGVMKIETGTRQRCRWLDESPAGFAGVDLAKGHTAEIRMQVLTSTADNRGVDLETYVGDGTQHLVRCLITVTPTGVYWYGKEFEALTAGLDNHSAMHTYRMSVRADGFVQVYRDSALLGVRQVAPGYDRQSKARRPYLQWGAGGSASETDALVAHVAYDLAGPFAP